MFIEANVTTSEGTIFKIPISDNEVLSETSYMHFLSPDVTFNAYYSIYSNCVQPVTKRKFHFIAIKVLIFRA